MYIVLFLWTTNNNNNNNNHKFIYTNAMAQGNQCIHRYLITETLGEQNYGSVHETACK